jgi:RNA polymerase sigma factor (TIGR02999 family)
MMSGSQDNPLTKTLRAVGDGNPEAAQKLLPLVYDELRSLARARLRFEQPGQTLQPTALVHEAYLRLVGDGDPGWDGRNHFFAAAALAMRRILVERARGKMAKRHGGGLARVPMDEAEPIVEPPPEDVLAVDEAVKRLESQDPRKGQIVNLRFFARMTTAETAEVLGVSVGTIGREWRFIRAWLECAMRGEDEALLSSGESCGVGSDP